MAQKDSFSVLPVFFIVLVAFAFIAVNVSHALADEKVAEVRRQTPISAHGGRVVWSSYDAQTAQYKPVVLFNGQVSELPVAPDAEPFDVDLGPGPSGGTVAVYSREDGIYLFDFKAGSERLISKSASSGSDREPTVYEDRLSFVRTVGSSKGRKTEYLYTKTIGRAASSRAKRNFSKRKINGKAADLDLGRSKLFLQYYYDAPTYRCESGLSRRIKSKRRAVSSVDRCYGYPDGKIFRGRISDAVLIDNANGKETVLEHVDVEREQYEKVLLSPVITDSGAYISRAFNYHVGGHQVGRYQIDGGSGKRGRKQTTSLRVSGCSSWIAVDGQTVYTLMLPTCKKPGLVGEGNVCGLQQRPSACSIVKLSGSFLQGRRR